MKIKVQDKPEQFEAEQFLVSETPWPEGVRDRQDGTYFIIINPGLSYAIKNCDWIVHRPGKTEIYSDNEFKEYFDIVGNQK